MRRRPPRATRTATLLPYTSLCRSAVSGGQRLLEMRAYVERNLAPRNAVGADTWIAYARGLDAAFATHKAKVGLGEKGGDQQGGCTSHMSAVDSEGNMVALTYTLLNRFGKIGRAHV